MQLITRTSLSQLLTKRRFFSAPPDSIKRTSFRCPPAAAVCNTCLLLMACEDARASSLTPLLLVVRVEEEFMEVEDGAPVVASPVDVGVLKSWCWTLLMGDGAKSEENISLMADREDVLTVSVSFSRVSALVLVLLLGETLTDAFTVSFRSVSTLVLLV